VRRFWFLLLLAGATPIAAQEPAAAVPFSKSEQLMHAVREISDDRVAYSGRWTTPGGDSLAMDCSNTARWLMFRTAGLQLPRTASSQYEYFRTRGKLAKVGRNPSKLRQMLKPGDLLFWKNTYRPKRKPPITHVMIYIGTTPDGRMQMVGSQGSRGPNVYSFSPEAEMGGYRWFFGLFKTPGRFVAFARPM